MSTCVQIYSKCNCIQLRAIQHKWRPIRCRWMTQMSIEQSMGKLAVANVKNLQIFTNGLDDVIGSPNEYTFVFDFCLITGMTQHSASAPCGLFDRVIADDSAGTYDGVHLHSSKWYISAYIRHVCEHWTVNNDAFFFFSAFFFLQLLVRKQKARWQNKEAVKNERMQTSKR